MGLENGKDFMEGIPKMGCDLVLSLEVFCGLV